MRGELGISKGPSSTKSVIVADGGASSEVVDCRGWVATHIAFPSGFDGTNLEIEGSMDGTNFFDLYDKDNVQLTMTVAASRIYQLPIACWGVPYLRFVVDAQTGVATLEVSLA